MRLEVTARGLLKIAIGVAACWLLAKLWIVLLIVVAALMIVGALDPIVDWLQARKVGRGWALGLVFGGIFLAFVGFVLLTAPPLVAQISGILEHLPEHQQKLAQWVQGKPMLRPVSQQLSGDHATQMVAQLGGYVLGALPRALEYLAYAVTTIFLALYFMIDRDRMRGVVYALLPKEWHVRTARVVIELQTIVGGYIRGQVLTSALMGGFLFVLLTVFRVKNAVAIAALGAFGDVIPYVGVLLTIVPAALAALAKGATTAIIVGVACAAYQEFENRVIVPRVYGRVLRLPSAAVLLALLVGGVLGGIVGSLLALPFAAALRMLVQELRVDLPGDDTPDEELREADQVVEEEYAALSAGASAQEAAAIAVELAEERQAEVAPNDESPRPPITGGKE